MNQKEVSKLNLNNVNEFSADKLKEYKDFYSKQLKTINDALKKYQIIDNFLEKDCILYFSLFSLFIKK